MRRLRSICLFLLASILAIASSAAAQTGWTHSVTDVSAPDGVDGGLVVGMDAGGNAIAAWVDDTPYGSEVWAARMAADSRQWSAPIPLRASADQLQDIDIAVDPRGTAYIVWKRRLPVSQTNFQGGALEYAAYVGDDLWQGWGPVPGAQVDAHYPQAAIDPMSGNLMIVWFEDQFDVAYLVRSRVLHLFPGVNWDAIQNIGGSNTGQYAGGDGNRLVIDGEGYATFIWTANQTQDDGSTHNSVLVARSAPVGGNAHSWGTPQYLLNYDNGSGYGAGLFINRAGNIAALWRRTAGGTPPFNDSVLQYAIFNKTAGAWSAAGPVPAPVNPRSERLALDDAGNAFVVWHTRLGSSNTVQVTRAPAGGAWTTAVSLSTPPGDSEDPGIDIDAAGNAIVVWNRYLNRIETAQASRFSIATGSWSAAEDLSGPGIDAENVDVRMDSTGNAVVTWEQETPSEMVQATSWLGRPAAPTITAMTPSSQCLAVAFTPPVTSEPVFAATHYEYLLENVTWLGWIAGTPPFTSSPIVARNLTNGTAYTVRVRALNAAGAGAPSAPMVGTPNVSGLPVPSGLRVVSITGNTVTLAWTTTGCSQPAGFAIEGGVLPGQVLASLPTGSSANTFTFTAPTGAFYVRVHAVDSGTRSDASNEIRIFVNVPTAPSAPENLTGAALGSTLSLAWRNTAAGGTPTANVLDVTGSISLSIALPASESFSYSGVPPGTYTFAVRASNSVGVSAPSNTVTLTFPGACLAPGPPAGLAASVAGSLVTLTWAAPATGGPPTAYRIEAGSASGRADLEVVTTSSPATMFSANAPPGSYFVRVVSVNPCGTSAASTEIVVAVR